MVKYKVVKANNKYTNKKLKQFNNKLVNFNDLEHFRKLYNSTKR